MLAFAHTLISVPFGLYLNNPVIIFASAFIWHLFCDTLLHWNIYPDKFKKFPTTLVSLDILGGLLLAWILTGQTFFTLPVLLAIAGGNMPDVLQTIWEVFLNEPQRQRLTRISSFFIFHDKLQIETTHPAPGLVSQVTLVTISIILILIF